ncbi:LysM peptidoglycan-binding domain-containing protein [uncultured Megasphaera sp.]|uniref:LysM peptidoglycan-binding domain-containing protein n=1 Tax=uncultured Megasphaera sp. TaxID=165188 RepID=UPI00266BB2A1|nr:LysM peptidoglycan-binding domain-containing protein [uncultured Megasphaera sp.]
MKVRHGYEHKGIVCYPSTSKRIDRKQVGKRPIKKYLILAMILATVIFGYVTQADTQPLADSYTVNQGDTVWGIAGKYASEEDDIRDICWNIMADNHISEDAIIVPGQQLIIRR